MPGKLPCTWMRVRQDAPDLLSRKSRRCRTTDPGSPCRAQESAPVAIATCAIGPLAPPRRSLSLAGSTLDRSSRDVPSGAVACCAGPRCHRTGVPCYQVGGRQADTFYRDRWSYDKVVRSTHGVNCTGSCSWKVYVKDGIITWESQQTDYPSVGGTGRSTSRGAAREGRRSPGTPTRRRGCATRTRGACWSRCSGRRRPGWVIRSRPGRRSRPTPTAAAATSGRGARVAWCVSRGTRRWR